MAYVLIALCIASIIFRIPAIGGSGFGIAFACMAATVVAPWLQGYRVTE